MSTAPLALQRLSRAEVRDARARSEPRTALTLPELDWKITVDAAREGRCGPAAMGIGVTWGEHSLMVRCPGEVIDAAAKRLDPALAVTDRPSDLAALLIEAALLPAFTAAEGATGRDIRLTGARPEVGPVLDEGLALLLGDGERTWALRVDATLQAIADLLSAWPVAPHAMTWLPIPAAVRIGTTRLTLRLVQSLRPGDAVLLEVGGGGGAMLVVADAWLAEAARHEDDWKLEGRLRPARSRDDMEWTMQDGENWTEEAESIGEADDLPVRLAFDVGRLDITLGELRRLAVGSILDIGRDAGDLVRIGANGKLVGQGTLVEVEGKVAVRIVRMFDHG